MDMTKLSTLIAMLLSASAGLPDEVQLFNGKDLDGWVAEGVKEFVKDGRTLPVWSVKNGCDTTAPSLILFPTAHR